MGNETKDAPAAAAAKKPAAPRADDEDTEYDPDMDKDDDQTALDDDDIELLKVRALISRTASDVVGGGVVSLRG